MTELKCPKCRETENIYYTYEKGGRHGIQCYNCGYEIRDCESVEEAEFKWRSGNDPKALRPCPFCGSSNVHLMTVGLLTDVRCLDCGCRTERYLISNWGTDGEQKVIEIWNRRANE